MNDTPTGGDLEPVVAEQAETPIVEDHFFDNLDDAVDALDDDMPENEEPDLEPEAEETPEPEDEPEETEAEEPESDEGDAFVTLPDGSEITLSEIADLQANGLRSADYTQKTTEVAEQRKALEAERQTYSERLQFTETALRNVTKFIEGIIPPEPTIDMAQTDPGAYTQAMALRNGAIAELQQVMKVSDGVNGHKAQVSDADLAAYKNRENGALVKAMPHLADPVKRAAFDKAVSETAADFGFSPDEIAQTADSRILQMVHYAKLGKLSAQNRANAKRRVQTPMRSKPQTAKAVSGQTMKNRQAMQRLSKSGSIEDALEIDFD